MADLELNWYRPRGWVYVAAVVTSGVAVLAIAPPVFRWDRVYLSSPPTAADSRATASFPIVTLTPGTAVAPGIATFADPFLDPQGEEVPVPPGVPTAPGETTAPVAPSPRDAGAGETGPGAWTTGAPFPTPGEGSTSPSPGQGRPSGMTPLPPDVTALVTPAPPATGSPFPLPGSDALIPGVGDRLATLPPSTWIGTPPPLPTAPPSLATVPPSGSELPLPGIAIAPLPRPDPAPPAPSPPVVVPPPVATAPTPPASGPLPSDQPRDSAPAVPPLPPGTLPPSLPGVPSDRPPLVPAPTTPGVPPILAPTPTIPPVEPEGRPEIETETEPEPEGIFVAQFQVLGSTVFSQSVLARQVQLALGLDPAGLALTPQSSRRSPESEASPGVLIPINRTLPLAELVQAGEAITQLYIEEGYINSGAVVLEPSITTGRPVIQVIEGQIEATTVTLVTRAPQLQIQRIPAGVRSPAPIPWHPQSEADPATDTSLIITALGDEDLTPAELNALATLSTAETLADGPPLAIAIHAATNTDPYRLLETTPPEFVSLPLPPDSPQLPGSGRSPQEELWYTWQNTSLGTRWLTLTGTNPLDPGYIGSRLQLAGGNPLNLDRLLEGVQLLQLNPLIEQIGTEINAGSRTGTSRLGVTATQAQSDRWRFSYDNSRSLASGADRQGVQFTQGNLLGWGDSLQLGYGRTQGSEDWDLAYQVPLSPYDTTLQLNLGATSNRILTEFFSLLDLISEARYTNVTLRQPLWQSPSEELALSLTLSHTTTRNTFLGGLAFPTPGADDRGEVRITAVRFGQEWLQRGEAQVIALQSEFSLGLDAFGSTISPDGEDPDSQFIRWQGRAQWARLLAPDLLLLVRGSLQLADRPLPATERVSGGGVSTVRGYRQNTLVTDGGWSASAELQIPVFRIPEVEGLFQIVPFVDGGGGWLLGDADPLEVDTLGSVGLGIIWSQGDYLRARLDWGWPLSPVERTGTSLQESGFHFSIILTP